MLRFINLKLVGFRKGEFNLNTKTIHKMVSVGVLSLFLVVIFASVAMAVTGVIPARISYYKSASGTFLFCNNPEQITMEDLGDSNLSRNGARIGNNILYSKRFSGEAQALFEHHNKTGSTIYYGIQLWNPNTAPVTATITNSGFSVNDWTGFNMWRQFFAGTRQTYTIPARGSKWIIGNGQPISNGMIFAGVIRFSVNRPVDANFYAYKDISKINGTASVIGYTKRVEPNGQQESRVYNGSSTFPMIYGNMSWAINDNTSRGRLPVTYNGFSRDNWVTNETSDKSPYAMVSDLLPLEVPGLGSIDGYTSFRDSYYNRLGITRHNLANYGVQYVNRVTITNNGARSRTIQYRIFAPEPGGNPFWDGANVVVRTPKGLLYKHFDRGTEHEIYTFTVPAKRSMTVEIQTIVSAPSSGDVHHYVGVTN